MPVRVLCLCSLGPPPTGQATVSNEVVRYFREHGHSVAVVDKKILGAGARKLGYFALSLLQITWHLALPRRIGLAYLTCSRSPGGFLRDAVFIGLCRLRGVPVINHVHGSDLPALMNHPWVGPLARRALNAAAANVMLSQALALEVQQAGLRNVVVIRNFAPLEYFAAVAPPREPGAPLRILYLSNVMQAKGVFDLIEACRVLEKTFPHFELHIVGNVLEGNHQMQEQTRRALTALAQQHAFVKWHGPLYGEEKLRAYAAADIFCLPSHAEAAPLTLLDAMALGVACVVTEVGGVPEIVAELFAGTTALVVPPHQPAALTERLAELAAAPELRRQLGARAREQARRHFTLDRFRRELGALVRATVRTAA